MKAVLGNPGLEAALAWAEADDAGDEATYEDEILKVMLSRGKQPNLSFFAFTATPKAQTLEVFGRKSGADQKTPAISPICHAPGHRGRFYPRCAAELTTYKTYYRLVKAIEDDPQVDKRQATKTLARFMSLHPHNIAQKTR